MYQIFLQEDKFNGKMWQYFDKVLQPLVKNMEGKVSDQCSALDSVILKLHNVKRVCKIWPGEYVF